MSGMHQSQLMKPELKLHSANPGTTIYQSNPQELTPFSAKRTYLRNPLSIRVP